MTSIVDFLYHWQSLEAGMIALVAAIITVGITLNMERRRVSRELDAFRKSLAIELRLVARQSLSAHDALQKAIRDAPNNRITVWLVGILVQLPSGIIYKSNAHRIGLLQNDAMTISVIYGLLEIARDATAALMRFQPSNNISPQLVAAVAKVLLEACNHAAGVIPRLRTGDAFYDDNDDELVRNIRSHTPSPQSP
jgi:hypothetical protein